MIIKTLKKDELDKLFETKKHQADVVEAIYRMIFTDYDSIEKLNGYPRVSRETNDYFFDKFIAFDKEHSPDVLAGGLWLNKGFSTDECITVPFTVVVSANIIEYKPEKVS